MGPTIKQIKAALAAHRGSKLKYTDQQLRRIWNATNPAEQVKYLELAANTKPVNTPRKDATNATRNESESDVSR